MVTFTVQSPDDLKAMREALKNHLQWIEADLTGFTSIRALHEATSRIGGFDIEYRQLREQSGMDDAVGDLDWRGNPATVDVSDRGLLTGS